jgi:hypothetical protein
MAWSDQLLGNSIGGWAGAYPASRGLPCRTPLPHPFEGTQRRERGLWTCDPLTPLVTVAAPGADQLDRTTSRSSWWSR